jgi:ABC-type Fe3+-hydroxamate transport system substrate-binding protein
MRKWFSFASYALVALALLNGRGTPAHAAAAPRIVSLMPSLTEDLFAIGAGAQVVGTSQFTDYPPAATRLPAVGSFAAVDAERIRALHPDVVVGIPAQAARLTDVRRLGVRVVLLRDDGYEDIFTDIATLGRLSGHVPAATHLIAHLQAETAALTRRVRGARRPSVFVVLGVAPIFTVGDTSYIARLIALAGGRNATGPLRDAYPRYSAEALVALHPDVLVGDSASGLRGVLDRSPWNALGAVHSGRVYILRDAALLERPGPRYNRGLAWLIAKLHPHG